MRLFQPMQHTGSRASSRSYTLWEELQQHNQMKSHTTATSSHLLHFYVKLRIQDNDADCRICLF